MPLGLDKSQKGTAAPLLGKFRFLPAPFRDRKLTHLFQSPGLALLRAPPPTAANPRGKGWGLTPPSLPFGRSQGPAAPHPPGHAGSQGPLPNVEAQCGGWQEEPAVSAGGRRRSGKFQLILPPSLAPSPPLTPACKARQRPRA